MSTWHRIARPALAAVLALASGAGAAWKPGTQFRVENVAGKPCLVAPDGRPFKSVGMVWAYGPEGGPELTAERVIEHLQLIKDLGFNTLNLYGDRFIPDMLSWCDEHELGVYFRTAYYSLPDFPGALQEYPDFMDPKLRAKAKEHYRAFLDQVRGHPSVLAIDMDNRWLFPLDWGGARRIDIPKLRPRAVAHLPRWLQGRYGDIRKLNERWRTQYASFDDITRDPLLVKDGIFLSLGNHPARVDLFRYTLWTAVDFLEELAAFMHEQLPGVIITPTTEHPECIPDINPPPDTGIAFMSPVHYNGQDDFLRDPPGLCKLIYETRWHYDLQGGPAYISETGFRTDTLQQNPPFKAYAWTVPPDEDQAGRFYAQQFGLLNVLPWVSGYGYFKLYDKWFEGDFGYLRDDGTKKPMALVGDAINRAFDAAALPDPEPLVWIYYPEVAEATHRPGFQQLKTLVFVLEKAFLDRLAGRVEQYEEGLLAGNRKAGRKFARAVTADFRKTWRGFAFTTSLPDDDKPVLLLSTISEILGAEDRAALADRKTVTFGPVGTCDEFMKPTIPWSLEAVGLDASILRGRFLRLSLTNGPATLLAGPAGAADLLATNPSPWSVLSPDEYDPGRPCDGRVLAVPPAGYSRIEFLAASTGGNAAPVFEVAYADGASVPCAMAPTISDLQYEPVMTEGVEWDGRHLSRIQVRLDPSRDLASVTLPDAPWVRLYGVVLARGGVARKCGVALEAGGEEAAGEAEWALLLPPGEGRPPGVDDLEVLQTFADGSPAVVASGRHVAYFYDPLNWNGGTNEISRLVDLHRDVLDEVLEYLDGVE